jgi:hypothetical protein
MKPTPLALLMTGLLLSTINAQAQTNGLTTQAPFDGEGVLAKVNQKMQTVRLSLLEI